MVNIHLVQDQKFVDNSINMFEKYYPNKNFFIVDKDEGESRFVTPRDNVLFLPFNHSDCLKIIQKKYLLNVRNQTVNVLVHFLTRDAACCALALKDSLLKVNLYWIFYGADLYTYLEKMGKYQLYDYKVAGQKNLFKDYLKIFLGRYKFVKDFCKSLNYFCFWNYYDYKLLCRYVNTKAEFKLFYYVNTGKTIFYDSVPQEEPTILVNHSASYSGNHLTVIEKLKSLSLENLKLIFPLSYGPEKHITLIKNKAATLFPNKCVFLEDYMPIDTYYKTISICQCAIMGHRRQEAGGNISFLLRNGKKVFLREDNTLLQYYRDLGCFVYSFEKDLNSKDDLRPLTKEQQEINRNVMLKRISPEKIDDMMLNLFKD